jgi:creatinine amidohydrolase
MTNPELEEFLKKNDTVLIPTGSTEQHGPHSPLGTDVFIPTELCRRVAGKIGAIVAPPLAYALSYPHRGFAGEFSLSIDTFMNVVSDLCWSFAKSGFRRLVFVNGHYDNTLAVAYGCARAAEKMPAGTRAFPINYWDGLPPKRAAEFLGPDKGMHANEGEVSAVLAINPALVDIDLLNTEFPQFPAYRTSGSGPHIAYFMTNPGGIFRMSRSGTWGDATKASAEKGKRFLEWGAEAVMALLEDVDKTFTELPLR